MAQHNLLCIYIYLSFARYTTTFVFPSYLGRKHALSTAKVYSFLKFGSIEIFIGES